MKRVEKGVFLVRKGLCTISNKVKIRKIREKRGNIRKTWSMTKKKSSEILNFCRQNGNFFRKNVILARENFVGPPNLAPGFRHWLLYATERDY